MRTSRALHTHIYIHIRVSVNIKHSVSRWDAPRRGVIRFAERNNRGGWSAARGGEIAQGAFGGIEMVGGNEDRVVK